MIYFAIGATPLRTGILHSKQFGFTQNGMRCSLFKSCPRVHGVEVTPQNIAENFRQNATLHVFRSHEEAEKFRDMVMIVSKDKEIANGSPVIWNSYPVFEVEIEDEVMTSGKFADRIYHVPPKGQAVHCYMDVARDHVKLRGAVCLANSVDGKDGKDSVVLDAGRHKKFMRSG